MDVWVLKRAAELLSPLPAERKLEILAGLVLTASGNSHNFTHQKKGENGNDHRKTYMCSRCPYLSIGKLVKFQHGYFVTEDLEAQQAIEKNELYQVHIFLVDGKPAKAKGNKASQLMRRAPLNHKS